MTYSYDRRAATIKPEVVVDYNPSSGQVTMSVLMGTLLGVWITHLTDDPEDDVDLMKQALNELELKILSQGAANESDLSDKVDTLIERDPVHHWNYGKMGDRDKTLSQLQWKRKQEQAKVQAKAFGKWLREWVVRFTKEQYDAYKRGRFPKEPCVTAGYLRGWLLDGGELPREWWDTFRDMPTRKQLSACGYALEAARKKGLLGSSLGGNRSRETRCYEPPGYGG